MKQSIVAEKAYSFAVRIIHLQLQLCQKEKLIYSLSNQLLKSGTSIGANIEEALGSYSRKEFSAKMSIAYKEARKTKYWIRLLADTLNFKAGLMQSLTDDVDELIRITGSIIKTSKQKIRSSQ